MLYQLSYSRKTPLPMWSATGRPQPGRGPGDGGEGNRTPDLVNAIHALSQLSYAPAILAALLMTASPSARRQQHEKLGGFPGSVKLD